MAERASVKHPVAVTLPAGGPSSSLPVSWG